MFIRFDRIHERDRQTDTHTDTHIPRDGIGRTYAKTVTAVAMKL